MKKRIVSAIIMIILFTPFLILGGYFYLILGVILGLMALWEMLKEEKNVPIYMKFISFVVCLMLITKNFIEPDYMNIINYPLLISMFFIYSFGVIINKDLKKYNYKDGLWLFCITLLIGLMFNGFIKVRMLGLYQIIYCLLIATMTDTFALFGGKLFGEHKLCREISPNKTIEGSLVGSLLGTIIGTLFYCFAIGDMNVGITILLTIILSIFGQLGDLFFSSIKRYYKIKDFSNIIPGHGGILDRLDSLLFVILGFLLYMVII